MEIMVPPYHRRLHIQRRTLPLGAYKKTYIEMERPLQSGFFISEAKSDINKISRPVKIRVGDDCLF